MCALVKLRWVSAACAAVRQHPLAAQRGTASPASWSCQTGIGPAVINEFTHDRATQHEVFMAHKQKRKTQKRLVFGEEG